MSDPIVVWALVDRWPLDELPANVDTEDVMVPVKAIDELSGIDHVTFHFFETDGTTPKSVTVGGNSAASHDVSAPEYVDVTGYGYKGEYWLVRVAKASLTQDTIVKVTVTCSDEVEHDDTSVIGTRTLRLKPSSPVAVYLKPTAETNGNGLSPSTPCNTIAAALTAAGTTADIIYCMDDDGNDATAEILGTLQTSGRTKFLIFKAHPANTGNFTFRLNARRVIRRHLAWQGPGIAISVSSILSSDRMELERNADGGDWNVFQGVAFSCDGFVSPTLLTAGAKHVGVIGCTFDKGGHAVVLAQDSADAGGHAFVTANTHTNPGTCIRNQYSSSLVEGWTVTDGANTDAWGEDQHFEFTQCGYGPVDFIARSHIFYEGNRIWNMGSAEHGHNYSWGIVDGIVSHIALVKNVYHCRQDTQQIWQAKAGTSESTPTTIANMQMVHNTLLSSDGQEDRGVFFSSTGHANVTYDGPIVIRNNVLHRIDQSATGPPLSNMTGDLIVDGNAVSKHGLSYTVPTPDNTITPGDPATNGWNMLRLADGNFTPFLGTDLAGVAVATDVRFDLLGQEISGESVCPGAIAVALSQPPVITAPASVATSVSTPYTFSGSISISDPDAGDDPLTVELSVSDGIITLASTDGLTITDGADESATVTFTGTLTAINTALDGLTYTPTTDYAGPDTLEIDVDDGAGGTDSAAVAILVRTVSAPSRKFTVRPCVRPVMYPCVWPCAGG